jgi:hypothetical protein
MLTNQILIYLNKLLIPIHLNKLTDFIRAASLSVITHTLIDYSNYNAPYYNDIGVFLGRNVISLVAEPPDMSYMPRHTLCATPKHTHVCAWGRARVRKQEEIYQSMFVLLRDTKGS